MSSPSFSELIATHGGSLKRLCRGYEADPARRQELEQEVMLALWKALPSFRGEASIRSFLLRVAHNTAIRHVGREARVPPSGPLDETLSSPRPDLDQSLDDEARRARLYEAVRRLETLDRALMLLHLEGLKNPEIAEILGLTPSNVGTKLSRLRGLVARQVQRSAS